MNIQLCRASGLPVEPSDLEGFKTDFRRLYDKASALCKKDMLRLQKKLAKVEHILAKKYPTVAEVNQPSSAEDLKALVAKYGNVMVSLHKETNELVLVILDREFGQL